MFRRRLILLLPWLVAAGCGLPAGGAGPTSCSNPVTCADDRSWNACCDAEECWYELSDGSQLICEGLDCAAGTPSAADLVAQWCFGN